jgi:cytoskeletal protein CcmA (bactofilin family)
MIFKKKKEVEQPEPPAGTPSAATAETLIASGIQIKGKIDGKDKVRISGYFEGDLQCDSMVSIEKKGRVNGTIGARKVVVEGEINGDINSAGHVDIKSEGRLIGNVKAANFTLAPKSVFDGQATIPRKALKLLILSRNGFLRKILNY